MSLEKAAEKTARRFARAVIRRKWEEILPLLSQEAQTRLTAESLEKEFGWRHLGPRLREAWIAETGEPEEIVTKDEDGPRIAAYVIENAMD
jgi:hypothetical protein